MFKRFISVITGMLLLFFGVLTCSANNTDAETSFPKTGLLPKKEIGALSFLEKHPNADGRGIIVAVLDTGVDPGAPGLQETTTGKPKIISLIDATGSGDVPTETIVELSKNNTLTGLSGRTLKMGKKWKNPTGEFRLGLAIGYQIFPEELVERLKEERGEKWMAEQRTLERTLQSDIDAYKEKYPKMDSNQMEQLHDLEKRLEVAKSFKSSYRDPGPIYDCVVYNDGELWRAVVDTDADSDLSDEKILANFDEEQEFATFGDDSLMNFGVNIYNDGNLLSIVADTGMHGTHVAGIVGAYFKDQPELNGVAPGAQIISIKIGDTRLGGMETPHALSRAVLAIQKYKCDMVNMSYGEATRFPQAGHVIDKLSSLVDDHNVVYVSSAGNSGPALTTVGAPGGTTSSIIGVGATITPELMKTSYSLLKDLPVNQFTWSSRGPTIDGDLGVDISAPGGAISPVPRWELSKNMRANGTSMAGPDACGGLALVLSALKQENKPYTATWVKRAVTYAAKKIPAVDVFGQGHGMIQVEDTYKILAEIPENLLVTPRYEISVGSAHNRGIYLRNGDLSPAKQTFGIAVKPHFPEKTDKEVEADYEARYILKVKDSWVTAPEYVFVNSLSKRFDVQVDTTDLEPGVHYTEVVATNSAYANAGPSFRIPVTVVKPIPLKSNKWEHESIFSPGEIKRFFFQVPAGATWATLKIESPDIEETTTFVVHPQHTIPGERYVNVGDSYYLGVSKESPREKEFEVIEGSTIELALAQYWSEIKGGTYQLELEFHGLQTELGDGFYAQGDKGEEFRVLSLVEKSQLSPSAGFTELKRSIAATNAEISVLSGERDQIGKDGEAYHQLVMDYPFTLTEETAITPTFDLLNDKIYEVEFESQLQLIFDANKQLVATEDTFPEPIELKKGDYTLRLQLRNKDKNSLEKLKKMNLSLMIDLGKEIKVKTYTETDHALLESGSNGRKTLYKNRRISLVVTEPSKKDVPDFTKPGDVLAGSLSLQKGSPDKVALRWLYNGQTFNGEKTDDVEVKEKEPTVEEEMADALVKLAAKYRKAKNKKSFDLVIKKLRSQNAKPISIELEQLRWFTDSDENGESSSQIKKSAKSIINLINQEELAQYYGVNHVVEDTESKTLSKLMKEKKDALIEAYTAIALASSKNSDKLEILKENLTDLKKWTDMSSIDSKIKKSIFKKEKKWGEYLTVLNHDISEDITNKDHFENRVELLKQLGWEHLVKYESSWLIRRFPTNYTRF